jgi:hypothetical protein
MWWLMLYFATSIWQAAALDLSIKYEAFHLNNNHYAVFAIPDSIIPAHHSSHICYFDILLLPMPIELFMSIMHLP